MSSNDPPSGRPRDSRVILLYAGTWDEREVSIDSARAVRDALEVGQ